MALPLFISAETRRDLVAVEAGENKIQQNNDVIHIAIYTEVSGTMNSIHSLDWKGFCQCDMLPFSQVDNCAPKLTVSYSLGGGGGGGRGEGGLP